MPMPVPVVPNVTQPIAGNGGAVNTTAWYPFFVLLANAFQRRAGVELLVIGGHALGWSNATPTTGDWKAGDVLFDPSPTVGQPYGRICRVSGNPGTWSTFANL